MGAARAARSADRTSGRGGSTCVRVRVRVRIRVRVGVRVHGGCARLRCRIDAVVVDEQVVASRGLVLHALEVRRAAARVAPPPRAPRRLLPNGRHVVRRRSAAQGHTRGRARWCRHGWRWCVHGLRQLGSRAGRHDGWAAAVRADAMHRSRPLPWPTTRAAAAHRIGLVEALVAEVEGQRRVVVGGRRAWDACSTQCGAAERAPCKQASGASRQRRRTAHRPSWDAGVTSA